MRRDCSLCTVVLGRTVYSTGLRRFPVPRSSPAGSNELRPQHASDQDKSFPISASFERVEDPRLSFRRQRQHRNGACFRATASPRNEKTQPNPDRSCPRGPNSRSPFGLNLALPATSHAPTGLPPGLTPRTERHGWLGGI